MLLIVDNFTWFAKDPNFSDDDDELFEELTNRALQVDAVQDEKGDLKIQVKVDPNVELETLVMTIPSKQKNIDVMGKVNAKKQSTLDAFFGLKSKPSTIPVNATEGSIDLDFP